MRDRRKI